jgi:hypothetical protein
MTTPHQRTRSVLQTRDFLVKLLEEVFVQVPTQVQDEARRLLFHFPEPWHLARAHERMPEDWGSAAAVDAESARNLSGDAEGRSVSS